MKILDERQIRQKIRRIAHEIIEQNFDEPEIVLAGLNNNGLGFAKMLLAELQPIAPSAMKLALAQIRLSPADPMAHPIAIDLPIAELKGRAIIIVDDVANTGRTLFFALRPIMEILPKKVEVAVLVERKHKTFPIKADYVGHALATTLLEDVDVQIRDVAEMAVYLN